MRQRLLFAAVLAAILLALATKGWMVEPAALRSSNAAGQFDTVRAAARLKLILGDERPHPADSAADDAVRGQIVALLSGMGMKPVVRDQMACNALFKQRGVTCARVRNVIAVLGPASGKALLLNAHYDSTPVGPGAGDDGAGVATLLEVGEILRHQQLQRPVILLFNEGEELGLVGARAFLADPMSRRVDSLVNLEARGVRGPANMFETSRPNAQAVAAYAASAAHPVANSLATDIYRLMPNYTDVNSLSERRWLTLNIAIIGNETRYHSAGDDVAALDPRSLQHMGDQTLALAERLAGGPTPSGGGDRIFMDLLGRVLVSLPMVAGLVLLGVLTIGFAYVAWRRRALARPLLAVAGTLVGAVGLAFAFLALVGLVRPGMFWRAEPMWSHLLAYACAIIVAVALTGRRDRGQLRAAFWLAYLLLGAALCVVAPGAAIYFLFPPLAALAGIALQRSWPQAETVGAWVAIVLLYLTFGAILALLEELLNDGPLALFGLLGALLVLPVLIEARPLVRALDRRSALLVAVLSVVLALAAVVAAPAYSADKQQAFAIEHVTGAGGHAFWSLRSDSAPLPAAITRLAKWRMGRFSFSERQRWIAPAPPIEGLVAPSVEVVRSGRTTGGRIVVVRLHPDGADNIDLVAPKDAAIRAAGTRGFVRPMDLDHSTGRYAIDCAGRSCDGLEIALVIGNSKPVAVTILAVRYGLPTTAAQLLGGRPRFARPQYAPDQSIAVARVKL